MSDNCKELILDDIASVSFYKSKECVFPVPFNVPMLREMMGAVLGRPVFHMGYSSSAGVDSLMYALFDTPPTIKRTEKNEQVGQIMIFDVSISVFFGFQEVRKAEQALAGEDFILIINTYAGNRYLVYSLPNASSFSVDEQMSEVTTQTIKAQIKSLSGFIQLL